MTYTEIQKLLVDKYKELQELSDKILNIINQKNKLDTELQILQLHRQALVESISTIEKKGIAILEAGLNQLEQLTKNKFESPAKVEPTPEPVKPQIQQKKELKNKSSFSMQPTIASEKKDK